MAQCLQESRRAYTPDDILAMCANIIKEAVGGDMLTPPHWLEARDRVNEKENKCKDQQE